MLRRLRIKNLAIVEDVELELGEGLTVITERPARASRSWSTRWRFWLARGDSELIREGAERLSVAGEFDGNGAVERCWCRRVFRSPTPFS